MTALRGLFSDKPAWLDHIFQAPATTKHENSPDRQHFVGDFRINQHGWTKILNVTATTKDENRPDHHHFVGHFRINGDMKGA